MWHYLSIWFNFWQALLSDTCSLWDQLILTHDSFYTFPWIWLPIWHLQSVRSVDFDAWQFLHLPLNLAPHLTPAVCEISWFWRMTVSTPSPEFGSPSDTCSLWDQLILTHDSFYTFPWIWLPIWHLQSVRSVDFDAWQFLHLPLNLAPHLTPAVCEISWFWRMTVSTPSPEFGSPSDTCSLWDQLILTHGSLYTFPWILWDQLILIHDSFYTFLWIWFPIWHLQSVKPVDFDAWLLLRLSLNLVPHLTPAVCEISLFWRLTASTPFSEFGSPSDICSLWDQLILMHESFYIFLWIWFHLTPAVCQGGIGSMKSVILMHDSFYTFLWIWFPVRHLNPVRSVDFDAWQLLHLSLNLVPHLTPAVCEISWIWRMITFTTFSEFGPPSDTCSLWDQLILMHDSFYTFLWIWFLHLTLAVYEISWFWCMTASTPFSEFGSRSDTWTLWGYAILTHGTAAAPFSKFTVML